MKKFRLTKDQALLGAKLLFVGFGLTAVLIIIMQFLFRFIGIPTENHPIANYIGYISVFYIGYLYSKKYSKGVAVLTFIILLDLVFSTPLVFFDELLGITSRLPVVIKLILSPVFYFLGWYVGKNTDLKLYLLNNKLLTFFFVIGVISIIFVYVSLYFFITKGVI